MAELILSKGYVATVDDADWEWLNQWKWTAAVTDRKNNRVYAYRRCNWDNAARRWRETIWLHRLVLGAASNEIVDHVNGDTLDNRKANLRRCDKAENAINSKLREDNTSGFKGVIFDRSRKSWRAEICCRNTRRSLGRFSTAEEAAHAYDAAARQLFGTFARTNEALGLIQPASASDA